MHLFTQIVVVIAFTIFAAGLFVVTEYLKVRVRHHSTYLNLSQRGRQDQ